MRPIVGEQIYPDGIEMPERGMAPVLQEQQQHSSPNSPRMRQAMTHAPGSAGVYVRVNP